MAKRKRRRKNREGARTTTRTRTRMRMRTRRRRRWGKRMKRGTRGRRSMESAYLFPQVLWFTGGITDNFGKQPKTDT